MGNGRVSVAAQRTSIWAGRRAWGRRRGREGKLGDSGWVAFALVGGAEGMCVVFCGEEDGEFVPG